jgi:hypothetical protein
LGQAGTGAGKKTANGTSVSSAGGGDAVEWKASNHGGTQNTSGAHEPCAPTGNDPIYRAQVGRALAAAIEDQQLMFDEHRLGHDGTEASWPRKPDDGNDQMK